MSCFSSDELELDKREGEDSFERLDNDYRSRYVWVTHEASPGDRLLVETSASLANVRRDRVGAASEEKGDFEVDDERDLDVGGLAQTWTWDRGARNLVRGGFELRRYDASFDYAKHIDPEFVILAPFSPPRPDEVTRSTTCCAAIMPAPGPPIGCSCSNASPPRSACGGTITKRPTTRCGARA